MQISPSELAESSVVENAARIPPAAILTLVMIGTALASLEVGLVNVALPTLAETFGVGPTTIQWVAIAYQLTIVGTLILFGRRMSPTAAPSTRSSTPATTAVCGRVKASKRHPTTPRPETHRGRRR